MEEITSTNEVNQQIASELLRLNHSFGNLYLHISGEGKVDFRGATGDNCGWVGMLKVIISGDIGCMTPYDDSYDVCALDNALELLYGLDTCPHLNSSANEKYVPSAEEWKKFVDSIKEELKNLTVTTYKSSYKFKLTRDETGEEPVVTVRIEPLCNAYVAGEFNAADKYEYLGVIEDYDQPKINHCWIVVNGEAIDDIEMERVIHFRHRNYHPRKGDYLLYDAEKNIYVVLPQEDYHIQ